MCTVNSIHLLLLLLGHYRLLDCFYQNMYKQYIILIKSVSCFTLMVTKIYLYFSITLVKYQISPNTTVLFFKEATLDSYYLDIAGILPTN